MPISAESFYCLRSALDTSAITPDIYFGALISGIDVDAMLDQIIPDRADLYDVFAAQLSEQVLHWHGGASANARALLALVGLHESRDMLRELLWNITGPIAEQYLIQRGWPMPKTITGDAMSHRPLSVAIPTIQALRLPHLVTALLDRDADLVRVMDLLRAQHGRAVEAFSDVSLAAFSTWIQTLLRGSETDAVDRRAELRHQRQQRQQTRKALRRSVQALNRLVVPSAYQDFMSPEGLLIHGCRYDYRVTKSVSLLRHTAMPDDHVIPYKLVLFNKQGVRLADGCVVFAAIPVLDQIVALALHVRDPDAERDLLTIANWSRPTPAAQSDGFMAPLLPPPVQDDAATALHLDDIGRLIGGPNRRFYDRRKRIMDCIERDVVHTLSALTDIPLAIYQYMRKSHDIRLSPATYEAVLFAVMTLFRDAGYHRIAI